MNKVTAEDFRELKEARIKSSLTARITDLEQSVAELEDLVEAVCDLLEAGNVVKFPDEGIVSVPVNYGGSK